MSASLFLSSDDDRPQYIHVIVPGPQQECDQNVQQEARPQTNNTLDNSAPPGKSATPPPPAYETIGQYSAHPN